MAKAIVAALLLAAVAGAQGCQVSRPPQEGPVEGRNGNSSFSPAGVERIREEGAVRLDWSSGHIDKADVGLEPDDPVPLVSRRDGRPLAVRIDAPDGRIDLRADRILPDRAPGRAGFEGVLVVVEATTNAELARLVRDGITHYGIDRRAIEAWLASFDRAPEQACDRLGWTPGGGTAVGLEVTLTMKCSWRHAPPTRLLLVDIGPLPDPDADVGPAS